MQKDMISSKFAADGIISHPVRRHIQERLKGNQAGRTSSALTISFQQTEIFKQINIH
jgi:hypothetical protein